MLRRGFLRLLGAIGVGVGAAPFIRRAPIDFVTDTGHRIGTGEVAEAVDLGVFTVRTGDRLMITVLEGGTLNIHDQCTIANLEVVGGRVNLAGEPLVDLGWPPMRAEDVRCLTGKV